MVFKKGCKAKSCKCQTKDCSSKYPQRMPCGGLVNCSDDKPGKKMKHIVTRISSKLKGCVFVCLIQQYLFKGILTFLQLLQAAI